MAVTVQSHIVTCSAWSGAWSTCKEEVRGKLCSASNAAKSPSPTSWCFRLRLSPVPFSPAHTVFMLAHLTAGCCVVSVTEESPRVVICRLDEGGREGTRLVIVIYSPFLCCPTGVVPQSFLVTSEMRPRGRVWMWDISVVTESSLGQLVLLNVLM